MRDRFEKSMKINRPDWVEGLIYVAAFVVVNVLSNWLQAPITYNQGQGWDGVHYYRTAEQFAKGEAIHGNAPYCYRVGTSFLAAQANPRDLLAGFKTVNLAANVLLLVLFSVWIRLHIYDRKIRVLIVLLLLSHWGGPFRAVYFYPASTDNLLYCFLVAGLICIHFAPVRPLVAATCLGLLVFFGVLFREVIFLLALALPFVGNPIRPKDLAEGVFTWPRMPKPVYWFPVLCGLAGFFWMHRIAHQTDDYSFLRQAFFWAYEKPWLTYGHALFLAFGPLVVLVLYNWRSSLAFLFSNQPLLVLLAGFAVLAYLGGTDTERFWYWTMPVTYVLVGKAIIENRLLLRSKALLLVLVLTQLIAQRVFWTVPDFPNDYHTPLPVFTVPSSKCQYLDLSSYQGKRIIEAISLAEYMVLTLGIIWWLEYRARRLYATGHAVPAGAR